MLILNQTMNFLPALKSVVSSSYPKIMKFKNTKNSKRVLSKTRPKLFSLKFAFKLPHLSFNKSLIAIILAHLIWGSNFIVAKLTLQEIPVMSLAFLRFGLATVLITPFLLTEKRQKSVKLGDLPRVFAVGVLMVSLNIAFFYEGINRTTVTQASALTMIIPMLSVLIGWIFLKEKVYIVNLVGIFLGLIGTALVLGISSIILGSFTPSNTFGNLLIILACLTWVIGGILSAPLLKKYSTLDITAISFFVGMITFLVPAVLEYLNHPSWPQQVTFLGIFGLLYITVLSSIVAYFLFEWGLGKSNANTANLFQYIEPLVATFLGVMILGENIRFTFVIGAIFVGLGAFWGTFSKPHHQRFKAHRH